MNYSKINNATILVTGGAGFIGSYVVELLLQHQPKQVIIIDNLIRGSHENMKNFSNNPLVKFVEGDVRDKNLVSEIFKGVDYVFHMAALRINACAANPEDGFEVMCAATFNIAQECVKNKVKKIIYSSSASVYGLAQNFPTPESDNPYDNQTFYGAAKLFGEQLFRSYKFMFDLDYVALRYFNAYGPRMDTDGKYTEVMIKWLDCVAQHKAPVIHGDGSTSMDFVFVEDIALANIHALCADVTDEAFNIGNCEETSLKELLDTLLKVTGTDLKPEHVESNTINPVGRRLADVSKAATLLEFKPETNLEEGLEKLYKWYLGKKKVV